MKTVLWIGQSLPEAMTSLTDGACPSPHADTHLWNGSTWVAPTGDGMVTYCNTLRQLTNEPIYIITHCVGGSALLPLNQLTTGNWLDTTPGSNLCTAIAMTQAALATLSGCTGLDRVEWWQGQQDCFVQNYADMYSSYYNGLVSLLGLLVAALGTDFQFCVWPVGRLPSGQSQQVVRAQMLFSALCPNGIEPGSSSHDLPTADGTHLTAASYAEMGRRGAWNAYSYFTAKAAGTLDTPHHGAGPLITGIQRAGYQVVVNFGVAQNCYLTPGNPWAYPGVYAQTDVNLTTNWGLWWSNFSSQLSLIDGRIVGGAVRLLCNTQLTSPVRVGHAWMQACAGIDVYDSVGRVCLPLTPDALASV